MRNRILIGALLLVLPGVVQAQQAEQTQQPPVNAPVTEKTPAAQMSGASVFTPKSVIDFGFRGNSVSGDPARYQRFRDLRDGGYIPKFLYTTESETTFFKAEANNVGYRDQRYAANYENIGKVKVNFEWNQIPLYISTDTKTLYNNTGSGKLTIDSALRQSVQNAGLANSAAAYSALTNGINTQADQFEMRSRRDMAKFNVIYSLNRDVDLKLNLRNTNRKGDNLMSFGFGTSPGLNPAVELGIPLDDRTTDLKGVLEFANTRGLFSAGFTTSNYTNHIPVVEFDNPMRATDAVGGSNTGGPAFGRVPMWASNNAYSFDVNGSYKLPARSRASAFLSIGRWNQNEPLIPATSNTALVQPPLERPSAEAKADVLSMVYSFTSRPSEPLWLNAKYRYYDYSNKTALFESPQLVGDWNYGANTCTGGNPCWENEPASYNRGTLDLDAQYSPAKYLGVGFGFGREDSDRTFRIFEKTAENVYRVTVDSTGNQYVTLRAKYEHSSRTGSGFDQEMLVDIGEQPDTRTFDIADRERDRTTAILTVTPVAQFDVNASVGVGKDNYKNTGFGMRDNKNNGWSLGFDVLPVQTVSFGFNYGFEKYTALQWSRTANPEPSRAFDDPSRDWGLDSSDKVGTYTASVDLIKLLPKTDIRLSYDLSDGKAAYLYQLPPGSTITTGINYGPHDGLTSDSYSAIPVVQLPSLKNKLTNTHADITHYVHQNLALGLSYWYEDYKVDDFSLNSSTTGKIAPTNSTGVFAATVYTGYLYRPYTAHTAFVRMSYLW